MGMWHRINNNSYTYTNNQGSGGVPYVNMWGDACCTSVTGLNNNKSTGYTTGGALVNSTDSGYLDDPDIKCATKENSYNNT